VLVLPYVWPLQEYIPLVEKELSAQMNQPVRIGGMSAASLPVPRLELQNVSIGGKQELQIGQAVLYFDVLTLPADTRTINKLELNKLIISATSFDKTLTWLQAIGGDVHYPVKTAELHGVRLNGDVPPLPAFNGNMDFDAHGRFANAALTSDDGKLNVKLWPNQGHMQLEVDLKNGQLPFIPEVKFGDFSTSGDVGDDAINFSNIDGSLYGGLLKGTAYLSWQKGWQLRGHISISSMDVDKALPGLKVGGEMAGNADLLMHGDKLMQLASTPHLDGNIEMKDGTINNLDIAETARAGKKQVMSGVTTFESLRGELVVDNSGQHLRKIRISAGATSMIGAADAAADGKLSGHMLVDMNKVRAGMGTMTLGVGGTVSDFEWSSVH
jgi:uncharacterized protein involved in outer membrane biogenesis